MKIFILVFLLCIISQFCPAKTLPVEFFSQLPDVSSLSLSPDGNKLVSLIRVDIPEKKGVAVQTTDLKTKAAKILLFLDNSEYIIYRIYWKDNKTILVHAFAAVDQKSWGHGQRSKYKVRVTRLLFVDSETGNVTKPFTPMFLSKFELPPVDQDTVIDTLPDDHNHVLMSLYGTIYKVDIHKGTSSVYFTSSNYFFPTITDTEHRLRAGYHYPKDGMTIVRYLDLASNTWKDFSKQKGVFSDDEITILGFGNNPNEMYFSAYHEDRLAVFTTDLTDPKLTRKLILADKKYDISGSLIYDASEKNVIGITGLENGGTHFIDPELSKMQSRIHKALPNTQNYLYSLTSDKNKFIVFSTSATESGTYYLGQRSPLKLEAIAFKYKNLAPDVLSPVTHIEYKARDGLAIEAFLTLPKDKPAKNLPTLMFPHGGPIARDNAAFDYWSQFFANKGYAVLQMNFRGSSGQGLAHRNAGLAKWGKEMQDDIEDGARHLIAQGIADPKSIAIVGASYGGYAALMGAVKTPDFYRCAISVAGVSNVYELVLDTRAFWSTYNVVDEQIGTGAKNLKDISPVNHVDKIKVPILLIHGEDDRQVDIKHSIQMRDNLLKAGKQVEFLSLPAEDHYLSNEKNRIDTFKAMDTFLGKCLPTTPPQ
jgi:dipeptidyl aminopeptidase/acylaminoacyl peptidase